MRTGSEKRWVQFSEDELIDLVLRLEDDGWTEDDSFQNRTSHVARLWLGPQGGYLHVHYAADCSCALSGGSGLGVDMEIDFDDPGGE